VETAVASDQHLKKKDPNQAKNKTVSVAKYYPISRNTKESGQQKTPLKKPCLQLSWHQRVTDLSVILTPYHSALGRTNHRRLMWILIERSTGMAGEPCRVQIKLSTIVRALLLETG
jgi:hypothetical protein